jgi:integrase
MSTSSMLGKAQEWRLIHNAPRLKLLEENGREVVIDTETEAKLLAHLRQPASDVFITVQDTGLRPDEVFRMRVENINLSERAYFNASGKTERPSVSGVGLL